MDTGNGTFAKISSKKAEQIQHALTKSSGVFCVGERLEIKGALFRVQSIGRSKMKLKLLKGCL